MNISNKLFIASHRYFVTQGRSDARFVASCTLFAIQILCIFAPLVLLKTITQSTLLSSLHSKHPIVYAPLPIIWVTMIILVYDANKINKLNSEYELMPANIRIYWNWAPLIIVAFWILICFGLVFLNKYIQNR